MTPEKLLDLFALYGKITEQHAAEILELLKKYTRTEVCKFCQPK